MSYLIFDIETVPDVVTGRKIYELDGLSDEDTASAMFALRRAKVNHEFLPHHLQKIVAISLLLVDKDDRKRIKFVDDINDADFLLTNHYYQEGNPIVINQNLKKEFKLLKEFKVDEMVINSIYIIN